MKYSHRSVLSRIAFSLFLGVSSIAFAVAADQPIDHDSVQLQPQAENGISYLTGGIGLDESTALKQTQGYNLHMTFSSGPSNQYLGSVDVVIQDTKGTSLLSLSQVGPMIYVKLPAGKYIVLATLNGNQQRNTIALDGKSTGTRNFHWND
jgi:hypothetical protein